MSFSRYRKDLPNAAVSWIHQGGRFYYVHSDQPGKGWGEIIGYVRAFNRAGANRIAKAHGAKAGSEIKTQGGIASTLRDTALREIGAAEVYRGNPGSKRSKANPFDGSRRTPTTAYVVHLVDSQTRKAVCGSTTGVGARDVGSVNCGRCLHSVATSAPRKNPPLVVFGNPGGSRGGKVLSRQAISIRYVHATDGQRYEHKFGKGDVIECLPDGSFRLYNANGKRLWKDFR